MKLSKLVVVVLFSGLFLVSCSKDNESLNTPETSGKYQGGVLILNEGSTGQGSVSFVSNDLSKFTKDAYSAENGEDLLGKYAQHIFFNGDYAYIIAGGSNTINVVDRKTFKLVSKIESGLMAPRYGVVKNGKAYVTNANTYAYANPATGNTDDYIAVINLTTNTVESKINLNATADRIVSVGEKLYITEPYNSDKVLVVNSVNNTLETPIEIGSSADTMEVKDGFLYVLRSPYGASSELVKINLSDTTFDKVELPASQSGAKNLDIESGKIYYTHETTVYAIDLTNLTATPNEILNYTSTSVYGKMRGFAVKNDKVFIADGGDFKSDSKAYVYSTSGTLLKELTVGVAPNGFYFNE